MAEEEKEYKTVVEQLAKDHREIRMAATDDRLASFIMIVRESDMKYWQKRTLIKYVYKDMQQVRLDQPINFELTCGRFFHIKIDNLGQLDYLMKKLFLYAGILWGAVSTGFPIFLQLFKVNY